MLELFQAPSLSYSSTICTQYICVYIDISIIKYTAANQTNIPTIYVIYLEIIRGILPASMFIYIYKSIATYNKGTISRELVGPYMGCKDIHRLLYHF
jgi:hypothetical protein